MTFEKILAENFLELEESQTVSKQKNKMREITYQISRHTTAVIIEVMCY